VLEVQINGYKHAYEHGRKKASIHEQKNTNVFKIFEIKNI